MSEGTREEFQALSAQGAALLGSLPPPPATVTSWLNSTTYSADGANPDAAYFDTNGFCVHRGFNSPAECTAMIDRMAELVDKEWVPGSEGAAVFRTDSDQVKAQGSSDYFLESADKNHYFAEKDAVDAEGKLKPGITDKALALNKAGHGLHVADALFLQYSTSDKIRNLVRDIGWVDPVIPQSMYIFKQPRIGGEVTSHQDSTFLHTTPRQSCLGLWLALHDATVENGCLWVRPGSHKEPLRRKFCRNPDHFNGDKTAPQMVFEDVAGPDSSVTWEGALPKDSWPPPSEGLFAAGFVPVECKAGDLVVFPGTLDHLSLPNYSSLPRHTFQLHLVEGPAEGVTWSASNWLQYPEGKGFLSVKTEDSKA
jgi:phytanoyl-CoA hydroxylase